MNTPEQITTAIAAIVCRHVPPTRICDQGKTCACWKEYALPAAKEIWEYVESLKPFVPSPGGDVGKIT